MYKLYDMETRELIEMNEDELFIVDAIGYDMSNNNRLHYMIMSDEDGYYFPCKVINSNNDFINYLNEIKNKYSHNKKLTKRR